MTPKRRSGARDGVDDVLGSGRDEHVGLEEELAAGLKRTAGRAREVINRPVAVVLVRREERVHVQAVHVVHRAVRGRHRDDDCPELRQPLRGGGADGSEALDHDAGVPQRLTPVGQRGVGRFGRAVARDAPVVIRDAAQLGASPRQRRDHRSRPG
jgi:hypothetical protein